MARIELNEVAHSYLPKPRNTSDYALKRIHNVWEDGVACALLGPSGCGKTTLLNIVSGLLVPSKGKVLYDGKDVTALPPEKANIAQVFQFPVLYDTMSVFNNLAFPLRNRGIDEGAVKQRVLEVAQILDLTPFLNKRAAGLAADAKQKISLGRGLVRSDVAAILFDEPLTVIDPQMKWHLRRKLKEIHEELKLTFIYVTHDQVEALTFADQVAVMFEGEMVQIGSPQDLLKTRNISLSVISSEPGNELPGMYHRRKQSNGWGAKGFPWPKKPRQKDVKPGGNWNSAYGPCIWNYMKGPATVGSRRGSRGVEDLGTYRVVTLILEGQTLKARLPEDKPVSESDVWLSFPPKWIRLFADERLIQ